jgi:hypothetical protein
VDQKSEIRFQIKTSIPRGNPPLEVSGKSVEIASMVENPSLKMPGSGVEPARKFRSY